MINVLNSKLTLEGYQHPFYSVGDKIFYSKSQAIKFGKQIDWHWPNFHVWPKQKGFSRPKQTFDEAIKTQCDLISDCYKKVRLFYSGGRDSGLILDSMLRHNSRLDEIAIYRRYPGVVNNTCNEFDRFNIIKIINRLLEKYNKKIPIVFYDINPEHFNFYSKNLDQLFFDYTAIEFFGHGIHTVAECYPKILENNFVNILGHAFPDVNDKNEFYWVDTAFNLTHNDPFTLNFFVDERNTDLAVNIAYEVHEYQKNSKQEYFQYGNGPDGSYFSIKEKLDFPKNGTPLDEDWTSSKVQTNVPERWILSKKDILYMANALESDIGTETLHNFTEFYENYEKNNAQYFHQNSIYTYWIGSVSETHQLIDG